MGYTDTPHLSCFDTDGISPACQERDWIRQVIQD